MKVKTDIVKMSRLVLKFKKIYFYLNLNYSNMVKGLKSMPIILIIFFLWTYYAYVVELCVLRIASIVKKVLYLIFINVFFSLVVTHYFLTMFIETGNVPDIYKFTYMEVEAIRVLEPEDKAIDNILQKFCYYRGIRTYTRSNNRIRYCMICQLIKPDRTHHCSTCEVCVLKMDHHCPWVDNCIGFTNYKIFFLLLLHTLLYCVFYASTSAEYVYKFILEGNIISRQLNYVVGFLVACIFGITMMAFLGYHIGLILSNQTTLEGMYEPDFINDYSFDLGKLENIAEVCGYNWCLWCLPVNTSLGDGVDFPVRRD